MLFDARSKKFQWGYLLTWQGSFAGDGDAKDVNVGALQPFGFYQLGKGLYLRSAPIWVYNFFAEPQFSVADDGPGQPQWQIYFALNMQFKN